MKTLISIDGGMSTGISVGTYSDIDPYELGAFFQFEGGVEGFIKKVYTSENGYGDQLIRVREGSVHGDLVLGDEEELTVVAEKFTARGGGQGFSLRTEHLEPLRVEGAMLAMGLKPHWRSPQHQYFAGGKTKAEKKKAQHKWLKDHGLYVTGKMVDSPDADDVRSSIAHAIAWLVSQRHKPTIEHYFKEEE